MANTRPGNFAWNRGQTKRRSSMRSTFSHWDFTMSVVKGFVGGGGLLKIAQGRGKMNHMRTSESSWEDQNDKPSPFLASLGHTRWGPEPSLYRVLFSHTWLCNFRWMPSSLSKLRPPNRGLPYLRTSISLKQRLNVTLRFVDSIRLNSCFSGVHFSVKEAILDLNGSFRTPLLSLVATKPYNIYRWPWIIVAVRVLRMKVLIFSARSLESWATCSAQFLVRLRYLSSDVFKLHLR